MLVKVGGHYGDAGYKEHACSDAKADTLSEECLIVLLHQAGHSHAKNEEKGSHADEGASIPRIEKGPCQCADEQQ
jgi:hypothetical protein